MTRVVFDAYVKHTRQEKERNKCGETVGDNTSSNVHQCGTLCFLFQIFNFIAFFTQGND